MNGEGPGVKLQRWTVVEPIPNFAAAFLSELPLSNFPFPPIGGDGDSPRRRPEEGEMSKPVTVTGNVANWRRSHLA